MKKIALILATSMFVLLLIVSHDTADAQAPLRRVFVAADGRDNNPCGSLNRPCQSLSVALAKVQAGGEIVILDSGDYQPLTINKAVDVVADAGAHPAILVAVGAGIEINAGAQDAVLIRGLRILSQGGGRGIHFQAGKSLHVENCAISGFTPLPADCCTDGILMSAPSPLFVRNTTCRGNFNGIRIFAATVAIEGSWLENNVNGLWAENNAKVTIRDSFAGGSFAGITAFINPASPAVGLTEINVENCLVTGNTSGIHATGKSGESVVPLTLVRVSNSTITNNQQGVSIGTAGSARLFSRGNNTLEGNNVDGVFTDVFVAK